MQFYKQIFQQKKQKQYIALYSYNRIRLPTKS